MARPTPSNGSALCRNPDYHPRSNREDGFESLWNQGKEVGDTIRSCDQNYDGYVVVRKVLLMLQILVGCHEHIEVGSRQR